MRTSHLRLAHVAAATDLRAASAQLLPPIPLLRRLLRAHRTLPLDMRSLGDAYVKDEFRRHRTAANPLHIVGFLAQWKAYLEALPDKDGARAFRGQKLDEALFEKMSAEQIGQLYELMHASKDVWKPVKGDGEQ